MRALALTGIGGSPEILDIDLPDPAPGEVQVRVHAASVNGFDLAVVAGYLADVLEHRFPLVLGKDFAGVIEAVGAGVDDYVVGDRVFGVVTKPYLGDGSFAELVNVPVAVGLTRLPDTIDFSTGGALGLAGVTALQAVGTAGVQSGQTVLVAGATGGVGSQAVQLAQSAGATVIATAATAEEKELVLALGADHTVDHTGDVVDAVGTITANGVDVVLHFAGEAAGLLPLVRPGGQLVSTLLGSPEQLPSDTVTVHALYANPGAESLDRLVGLHQDNVLSVVISDIYPLERAGEAFDRFASGTLGKVVITTT